MFAIPSGNHICTFRRGSRPADIHCLSFSNDSSLLVACSSSGTVHIFDVSSAIHSPPSSENGTAKPKSRSQSSDSIESSGATEGRASSWTSSAYTYMSMAQSWGTAVVSGLNVLPEPLQEYTESIRFVIFTSLSLISSRAVAVARVPPTSLTVNGTHHGRMYLACILESRSLSNEGTEGLVNDDTTSESNDGHKIYKIVVVTKTKQLFRFD